MNTTDCAALARIVEALEIVLSSDGGEGELEERIAADWRAAKEERLREGTGRQTTLRFALHKLTRLDPDSCDEAIRSYLSPSYTEVAIQTLLTLAAELSAPPIIESRPAITSGSTRRKARVA